MAVNINANLNINRQSLKKAQSDINRALSGATGTGGRGIQLKLDDRSFTQPLGRITGQVSEFRKSLEASNARVVAFAASAGVLYKLSQAFDFVLKSTINVEKQLTDINVVLGASDKQLRKFGDSLFSIAAKTGQSFQVVANAATEFSRQGLTMEQTLKRTSDALVLARLSGMDTVEATNALTAAVNSFSNAAVTTTQVVNKLAAVDAAFAVSSTDLAEGLKRSAAAAESAGVSMDELLGLITAVQERTARGGAVIGNSFKTIFTRIQRPEVINQLERLGVQVYDLYGQVRPALEVMRSFAKTFDTLSQSQKSVSAELVGGVFQVNNLKAALADLSSEYSRVDQAIKISATATNEAISRNELLNDTLAARINLLQQQATRASAFVGESTLKPIVDRAVGIGSFIAENIGSGDSEIRGVGEKIGSGILKGIGDVISGPGLVLIIGGIAKLMKGFLGFTTQAVKEFAMMGTNAGRLRDTENQIKEILSQNLRYVEALNRGTMSRRQVELEIVSAMQTQASLIRQISSSGAIIGPRIAPVAAAFTPKRTRSHGHVPYDVAAQEISGAFAGGYTPGQVRSMNIPGVGKVAYNTRETVKTFPGFSQPAIMPPASSKAGAKYRKTFESIHGFSPMATGGVPSGGMTFGQSTLAQQQYAAQQAALYAPRGQAAIASLLNMGAASSGIKVGRTNAAGNMVPFNADNATRRAVQQAYQSLIKDLEVNGLNLQKEAKVREYLARKYNIADQSLDALTRAYVEESQAVQKRQAKEAAAQAKVTAAKEAEARNRQKIAQDLQRQQNINQAQIAQKSADKLANRQMGMGLAAFALPNLLQIGNEFTQIDRPASGAEVRSNKIKDNIFSSIGQAGSGALIGGMMGFTPYGMAGMAVLSALPSITETVKNIFDPTLEPTADLKIANEKLTETNQALAEFEKALATVKNLLAEGTPNFEALSESMDTLFSSVGKSTSNSVLRNQLTTAFGNYLSADPDRVQQGKEALFGTENEIGLISKFRREAEMNVNRKAGISAVSQFNTNANMSESEFLNFVLNSPSKGDSTKTVRQAMVEAYKKSPGAGPNAIKNIFTPGDPKATLGEFSSLDFGLIKDQDRLKSLGLALEDFISKEIPIINRIYDNAEKEGGTTLEKFKKDVEGAVNDYRDFISSLGQSLQSQIATITSAQDTFSALSNARIDRFGSISSERSVAKARRDANLESIRAAQRVNNLKLTQSILGAKAKVSDPIFQVLSNALSGSGDRGLPTFMSDSQNFPAALRTIFESKGANIPQSFFGSSFQNQYGEAFQEALGKTDPEMLANYISNLDAYAQEAQQIQGNYNAEKIKLNAQETKEQLLYLENLEKINQQAKINFAGGISQAFSESASLEGLKFGINNSVMRRSRNNTFRGRAALSNLQAYRQIAEVAPGALTPENIDQYGGRELRQSLMNQYDLKLRGMGFTMSQEDLRKIAQTQIDAAIKPENDLTLPVIENMNDGIARIANEGIKVINTDQLAEAIIRALDPNKGKGSGGQPIQLKRLPDTAEIRERQKAIQKAQAEKRARETEGNITLKKLPDGERSSNMQGIGDAFFFGRDTRTEGTKVIDLFKDLGESLRGGFAAGLKEAIFAAEDFGDALRSIGMNVLSQVADKLFSFAINAAFNAAGTAMGFQASKGAKGGYVTSQGIQKFASGGLVKGGSGFRDDVPAMLSQGEFVIRKSAVQKYGQGFLNTLNMAAGGAVISAPNTLIANDPKRPTDFDYKISSRLSAFAVTNEEAKDVQNRRDLADRILQNRGQYLQAMQAYKQEQRGRLIQGYISAAMILGAHGLSQVNAGGAGGAGGVDPGGEQLVNTGGFVRRYASGGYVDDVPAMLMGGEMVMNRDSVNRYGRGFFDKLNRGQVKMAEGGMVGGDMSFGGGGSSTSVIDVFDRLIESNEALRNSIEGTQSGGSQSLPGGSQSAYSAATNNVTININVDKTGATSSSAESQTDSPMNQQKDEEKARNMSESIRAACLDVIINEKRPGGALADLKSPRS